MSSNLAASSEIQYPHKTTGQPDPADALKFTWTLTGHVASRTDQRGVTLRYGYGDCAGGGFTVNNNPTVDQLACVDVTYPSPNNGPVKVDESVDHLEFKYDAAGRPSLATAFGPLGSTTKTSEVAYQHDAFGNLMSETLHPLGNADSSYSRTTAYAWQWRELDPTCASRTRQPLSPEAPDGFPGLMPSRNIAVATSRFSVGTPPLERASTPLSAACFRSWPTATPRFPAGSAS